VQHHRHRIVQLLLLVFLSRVHLSCVLSELNVIDFSEVKMSQIIGKY
jgi:hypothetical protein